jgi:asparagine synthase (glutamine-hydrolysing)
MCGIAGVMSLTGSPVPDLDIILRRQAGLIAHRGPDGEGFWRSHKATVGLAHRRLAIIDLSKAASQPMSGPDGTVLVFNGEIYNYRELRHALRDTWDFQSDSDTECILAAYARYGDQFVDHLRGMFALALWDARRERLVCARDRFGIKPFYFTQRPDVLAFASEAKALLPLVDGVRTNHSALAEYFTFQYTLGSQTLFAGIEQLLPGHILVVEDGRVQTRRYWDVSYRIDFDHTPHYFSERIRALLTESVELHSRSDVEVGAYVSGGVDSSLVYRVASRLGLGTRKAFHGRFVDYPGYDESHFAQAAVAGSDGALECIDITAADFSDNIADVIYHLDYPVAGPGALPQYLVSRLARRHVKVVLGGQGGDELFGGYARYLLAYFEQCIRAAIDGQYQNGNYVVTIESIVPNLGILREYKPLMREFWREGLFGPMDERYFRLVNRANDMGDDINWRALELDKVFQSFQALFNNRANVGSDAYFDKMTHFDLKTLLPALLQVEDRMSMAHGLESRVPLLDHPLVEFTATIPADVKFSGGRMKHLLKEAFADLIPGEILHRRDKMGFPVPLKEWFQKELREFATDTFASLARRKLDFLDGRALEKTLAGGVSFSRKTWGLLSLELWHQQFHDKRWTLTDSTPSPIAGS